MTRAADLLEREVRTEWPARAPWLVGGSDALTIGLEHEVFLLEGDRATAASAESSQGLFRQLATLPEWSARPTRRVGQMEWCPGVTRTVDGVSVEWKYDHPPHQLELTVGPTTSLADLGRAHCAAFDALYRAAGVRGFAIAHGPELPERTKAPVCPFPEFEALRHTRRRIMGVAECANIDAVHYASRIAAVHVHLGGLPWVSCPSLVDRLYAYEPALAAWTAVRASSAMEWHGVLSRRWAGYRAVFGRTPLWGVPTLAADATRWTLTGWCQAVSAAPLLGGVGDAWAGRSWDEVSPALTLPAAELWARVRDLQLLKPRWSGTLECRADPAPTDPSVALEFAAVRVGLALAARADCDGHSHTSEHLGTARREWLTLIDHESTAPDPGPTLAIAAAARHRYLSGRGERYA